MRSLLLVIPCAVVAFVAPASAADLKITTAGSKIEFVGTKKDGSHTGGFKQFSGTVSMPSNDLSGASIKVEIDANSLFSDNDKLTGHLKTPDFFDVRKYPKATFASTSIKSAGGTHTIAGDLTLHGVTKSVTIPAKVTNDANGVTIAGTFTINKEDFGMVYGKGMINNEVKITINVKATK